MSDPRAEHLAWAKQRALLCCDEDDPIGALMSLVKDLLTNPNTDDHTGIQPAMFLLDDERMTTDSVREFIEGLQ